MTGVGGRPEVIIEGSNDLDGPWMVQYLLCSVSPVSVFSFSLFICQEKKYIYTDIQYITKMLFKD